MGHYARSPQAMTDFEETSLENANDHIAQAKAALDEAVDHMIQAGTYMMAIAKQPAPLLGVAAQAKYVRFLREVTEEIVQVLKPVEVR